MTYSVISPSSGCVNPSNADNFTFEFSQRIYVKMHQHEYRALCYMDHHKEDISNYFHTYYGQYDVGLLIAAFYQTLTTAGRDGYIRLAYETTNGSVELTRSFVHALYRLAKNRNMVPAIKLLREQVIRIAGEEVGLKEAKDCVDYICANYTFFDN